MTGYVVDRAIDVIALRQTILSPWGAMRGRKISSVCRFFTDVFERGRSRIGSDLSRGLIVDSGNDACVALATILPVGNGSLLK